MNPRYWSTIKLFFNEVFMQDLISIIVPIYNAEKTLDRCVKSLQTQTYKSIEIILVNDGSNDNSISLCQSYANADNRIVVIDKSNGGVSSARNAGLNIANGKFVMFCDSDDWAEKDWCEVLLRNYRFDTLTMCGAFIEGEQPYLPYKLSPKKNCYIKHEGILLESYLFNPLWNKIYEKRIIEHYKIRFHNKLTNGEDYLFNLQYLNRANENIHGFKKCLYHYSWPQSETSSTRVPEGYQEQVTILFDAVFKEIERITGTKPSTKFYTDFFYQYQRAILARFEDNTDKKVKAKEIEEILRINQYQLCAKKGCYSTNKLYRIIWQNKSGILFCREYTILCWLLRNKGR